MASECSDGLTKSKAASFAKGKLRLKERLLFASKRLNKKLVHNLNTINALSKKFASLLIAICVVFVGSIEADTVDESESNQISTSFNSHEPIPQSDIALYSGAGIVKAMLSCATERYEHGVLGDKIEAGCLIVEDQSATVYQLDLPYHQVFEDLVPRIADMDGDGHNDVVLVRSDAEFGAALVIYSLEATDHQRALRELSATPPIGTANRWLAPVGIADFNNDAVLDVAYVQTPHIAGTLKVWSFVDNKFQQLAQSRGYSNHRIGATRVSTAKLQDYNNDGVIDLALPDQMWQHTLWVTLYPRLEVLDSEPYDLSHFD